MRLSITSLATALVVLLMSPTAWAAEIRIDYRVKGRGHVILKGDYAWVKRVEIRTNVRPSRNRGAKKPNVVTGAKASIWQPRNSRGWKLDVGLGQTFKLGRYSLVGVGKAGPRTRREVLAQLTVFKSDIGQGSRKRKPRQRPSKRALLVLLENDGMAFVLTDINKERVKKGLHAIELPPLPYLVYKGPGPGLELKLNKNESIPQALARLAIQISTIATQRAGEKPSIPKDSWGKPVTVLNPLDPKHAKYTKDLNAYNARIASNLAKLMNRGNWGYKTQTMSEALNVASDFLLEEITKGFHLAQSTPQAYDKVVVLEDSQVTARRVLSEIGKLAPNYVLDIHTLLHGGTDMISGYTTSRGVNSVLNKANFFDFLQEAVSTGAMPLFLRAVYQMNCRSGSLKKEWRAIGAEVVNGTRPPRPGRASPLNSMPHQYFAFMDLWIRQGRTFEQATTESYNATKSATVVVYAPFVAGALTMVVESKLTTEGNGSLRLTSP